VKIVKFVLTHARQELSQIANKWFAVIRNGMWILTNVFHISLIISAAAFVWLSARGAGPALLIICFRKWQSGEQQADYV
jgi:hypothetical protein